jgi:hypothetical protein
MSARSGALYKPGIGPHQESLAVEFIASELQEYKPADYRGRVSTGVGYPGVTRQKCDLCLGSPPFWDWAIEVKMLRLMWDNGKPNDNMLMHILSPYEADRSALTDCGKLAKSTLGRRKAVVVYGFDYNDRPLDPAIEAFELLAGATVRLGSRFNGEYRDLIHPVHQRGRVFGWEVLG